MNSQGEGMPVVELADFEVCQLEEPVAALNQVNMLPISLAYLRASAAAQSPCSEVYRLLHAITGIHLVPANRGNVWGANGQTSDRRTMVPSDIRGRQSEVLEGILPTIRHPAMRARIADIVWTNDLRKGHVARIAIEAYCDCVEGLMSGALMAATPVGGRHLVDAQTPAHRVLQIASGVKKKGAPMPERVIAVLNALYQQGRREAQPIIFSRLVRLCVEYRLVEAQQAATDLEAVALARSAIPPDAVREAFDVASSLYGRAGDADGEQRCQMGAVRQMLRMRDECEQPGAKAAWVMDALLRLRHIRCEEAAAMEEELEAELRRLQRASIRDLGSFEIDIALPEERERILEVFAPMDFSTAMKSFALLKGSPKMEDLEAEALRRAEDNPLSAMMAIKHVDDMGRTVVNTDHAGTEEPSEAWFVHAVGQAESLRRAMVVANRIEPVRLLIAQTIAIEERHFRTIVGRSHFVPELQAPFYALGFARFFQGDFPSAVHLLTPQLEASLRHVLRARGSDPTKRRDDATEEDRSLDAIIGNHRSELIEILTEPVLDELNRIFNVQPGPTLRHDVAHGQLSAGQCYSSDAIYACWLLYRVCCGFLMPKWDEWVRPGLAIEEPGR